MLGLFVADISLKRITWKKLHQFSILQSWVGKGSWPTGEWKPRYFFAWNFLSNNLDSYCSLIFDISFHFFQSAIPEDALMVSWKKCSHNLWVNRLRRVSSLREFLQVIYISFYHYLLSGVVVFEMLKNSVLFKCFRSWLIL